MPVRDVDVSRAVSHALRHQPWRYEIELDEDGWAPLDQLLDALRDKGDEWATVDRAAVERMLATATKRRHELDGDRIRALYGHSVADRIRKIPAPPPAVLFHGTAPATWDLIRKQGLRPMRRQYVHLSVDREMATAVGGRKSRTPVILVVHAAEAAAEAAAAGVRFFAGNDRVWLADDVPARFIDLERS